MIYRGVSFCPLFQGPRANGMPELHILSVTIDETVLTDHAASLWGIEANYPDSDNAYLSQVANELLSEALDAAKLERERLRDYKYRYAVQS